MVTFQTDRYQNIIMLDRDARVMIRLMGLSDTVPSALKAADVPTALERLRNAVEDQPSAVINAEDDGDDEDDDENRPAPVPLRHRALPLIELLECAARNDDHVIWE